MRKFIVLDTETANSLEDALVYDCGFAVVDRKGNVYETYSFINEEIFNNAEFMNSAYYSKKIPSYLVDIAKGERIVTSLYNIKKTLHEVCKKWNVEAICCHNARFDYRALQTTQRYGTKSKYRYFFPYDIEIWDSLKMATDTIGKQKKYRKFCEENGFMTNHKTPRPRLTAEILYRYITGNLDFVESHTGLEDVMIEKEIVAHCFRQHKKMRKSLFNK